MAQECIYNFIENISNIFNTRTQAPHRPIHEQPKTQYYKIPSNEQDTIAKGSFKCYVTQMGVGGCQIFRKKALRRCKVQRY